MDFLVSVDVLLGLVSAVAGFLVGQANGYFDRRSERRKAYSRALAELLEIRHRFKGSMYMLRKIGTDLQIPREYLDEVISGLPEGLLWDRGISERYNEAVDLLSTFAPLTAYSLRSKDIVGKFCEGVPVKFGLTADTHRLALENMSIIEQATLPSIEEAIENIAGFLGSGTKKDVTETINSTRTVSSEVEQSVGNLVASINCRSSDLI